MAGRFKIVKFIARGGMGDVYEAEDLELHERVALKTIRPEIAGVANAMERFKREIQLARKATHPNVCRIFDLFRDTNGSDDITFLTMELLNGETLYQRVTRARAEQRAKPSRSSGKWLPALRRRTKPALSIRFRVQRHVDRDTCGLERGARWSRTSVWLAQPLRHKASRRYPTPATR
jgi:serine/threonine protein kinase